MNFIASLIVGIILLILVILVVCKLVRDKHNGTSHCGGNCSNCGCHCGSTNDKTNKSAKGKIS